mmetsp:Transcript_14436/g.36111  ORF Transcript_14436/g.36111 Transcript_14436/m.36111 type:complete len:355 (-) Transcript_14436:241-1305(-)|eukprot:g10546.t1
MLKYLRNRIIPGKSRASAADRSGSAASNGNPRPDADERVLLIRFIYGAAVNGNAGHRLDGTTSYESQPQQDFQLCLPRSTQTFTVQNVRVLWEEVYGFPLIGTISTTLKVSSSTATVAALPPNHQHLSEGFDVQRLFVPTMNGAVAVPEEEVLLFVHATAPGQAILEEGQAYEQFENFGRNDGGGDASNGNGRGYAMNPNAMTDAEIEERMFQETLRQSAREAGLDENTSQKVVGVPLPTTVTLRFVIQSGGKEEDVIHLQSVASSDTFADIEAELRRGAGLSPEVLLREFCFSFAGMPFALGVKVKDAGLSNGDTVFVTVSDAVAGGGPLGGSVSGATGKGARGTYDECAEVD